MERQRAGWVRTIHNVRTAGSLAWDAIRAHKLRSFLTLLGVIIGAASLVTVGAAIHGLGIYAEDNTAKVFGTDTFMLAQVAAATTAQEYWDKMRRNKPIRYPDFLYLQAATGDQILYSTMRMQSEELRRDGAVFDDAAILGVSFTLPEIRDVPLSEGRFFTQDEERRSRFVCVIAADVARALFAGSSAVGQNLRMRGYDFHVVGVLDKVGAAFGMPQDNLVYIPATVYSRLYGTRQSLQIYGKPRPGLDFEEALDMARVALRTRFRTPLGQPDNFDVATPEGVRAWVGGVLGMISAVVVPVTCISLLVGGIVIMNIMLVTVTERTHEIGIRKSLGARSRDIQLQFLLEAILLAGLGGVTGVAVGAALAELLESVFQIALAVTVNYALLAVCAACGVGILSGWYPARRAARLDPVAAIRME
ncbi:MAG: ABC transporter permease [Bryobacterales bacterium]|nr:ABC transporter permease [Bryobacteraceae bacterium]MDW8354531.1 ABC transporter permease [Bryobacterales bacterium]